MTENGHDILLRQAEEALRKLTLSDAEMVARIAESVLRQEVYWEQDAESGEKLLLLRFFSPVIQREEVFLGNILLNYFLSKAFARAVTEGDLGRVELVANDLENYYFLVRTNAGLAQLTAAFRAEAERRLPELFFGEPAPEKGIYGSLETMLDFEKANVEPFPVFIMPQAYAGRLEKAVRASLLRKIQKSRFERNPTSIMANLAFFYSRDGREMQSPYLFLGRLMSSYGLLDEQDFRQAFFIKPEEDLSDENTVKQIVENALKQKKGRTFSPEHVRQLLEAAVTRLGEKVDQHPEDWLMPYIRDKFLERDAALLTDALLEGLSLGYQFVQVSKPAGGLHCRVCGIQLPEAEDKTILMGQNTHKFHNQAGKQRSADDPKACLRCAVCTYLMVKLIGSEAVGQPQVPKTYNLIFHYGRHTDCEVEHLTRQIDLIWTLVRKHREAEQVRRELREQRRRLEEKYKKASPQKKAALAGEMAETEKKIQEAEKSIKDTEASLYEQLPWLKDIGASPVPVENPTLDVLANLQLSASRVERHVLGLGLGGYRMILFVLPQIRPPYGAKEHDFAQRRFSDSRVTVTAVLAFLRHVCGCDGPFYYQSLPTLTPEAFRGNTFYIRNEPVSVEKALQEYEAVTQLAWKLIWERGPEGFVKKVVEAEKLLEEPLSKFASVMRDSAILGQKKGKYRQLPGSYRPDWRASDLTEYVKFIQKLSKLHEAH